MNRQNVVAAYHKTVSTILPRVLTKVVLIPYSYTLKQLYVHAVKGGKKNIRVDHSFLATEERHGTIRQG